MSQGRLFHFFGGCFWDQKIDLKSEKGEQVFRHELFHIEQKHSLDIVYMELLTTFFWINPFMHLIKKEIKIIHEFLADQFAVNQSKNWKYAELLLMQSLNTDHPLTNPFFYNQIKRRIAMITSSQKTSYRYLRKVMVLPVAIIVVALFAFSYKSKKEKNTFITLDKPVTVVIDAGHGVDAAGNYAGAAASDGSHEDDIVLSIAKKIKELNTNDRLQVILTRENQDIVDLKKRVEFTNSQNADLFISLHMNVASEEEKNTKGIDILYSAKNTKYSGENKILATILYNYFYQIHSVNGITQPKKGVYVIDNSPCPSVLVECGYLTDPTDLAFLKDETGQEKIAKSILQSIEQYFLQKGYSADWEERKKTVSDTATPVIKFGRNTAGQMEGSYNGKKFNKMTDQDGQFVFLFDDDSSTIVMISKEQTEELKKKYGKNLNELMTQNPDKREAEKKAQKELKESLEQLEQKQLINEKSQVELKELLEEKQSEQEKQESELKELVAMKQLEMEKAELQLKELINLKQQQDQKQSENSKKEYLLKEQKDREYLEQSQKDYLIKQQKDQDYLERSKKEYLLKQQKDREYLEKSKKELEKQILENKQ